MIADPDPSNHISQSPKKSKGSRDPIRAAFANQQTMLADIPRNLTHPNKTLLR
jgi:hypothetical protein